MNNTTVTPSKKETLFVFDWDGTVMDTTSLIAKGLMHACGALGYQVPTFEAARATIGLGAWDTLQQICPTCPYEDMDRFYEAYRDWYIHREAELGVVDGMENLLRAMNEAGFRLAVATGKSRRGLDRVFALTHLEDVFEETITADESFSKPHPAMLEELSIRTAVPCSAMIMIGDSIHDMEFAQNAGAKAVAVTWGASAPQQLARYQPLGIVDDINALAKVLGVEHLLN